MLLSISLLGSNLSKPCKTFRRYPWPTLLIYLQKPFRLLVLLFGIWQSYSPPPSLMQYQILSKPKFSALLLLGIYVSMKCFQLISVLNCFTRSNYFIYYYHCPTVHIHRYNLEVLQICRGKYLERIAVNKYVKHYNDMGSSLHQSLDYWFRKTILHSRSAFSHFSTAYKAKPS